MNSHLNLVLSRPQELAHKEDKILSEKLLNENDFHIIPIGGYGQFGMNCTLYVYEGQVLIVDAGLAFAHEYEIGVDSHIIDMKSYI